MAVFLRSTNHRNVDRMINTLTTNENTVERRRILQALGYTTSMKSIHKRRKMLFTDVLRQNELLGQMYRLNTEQKFVTDNWEWLKKNYNKLTSIIPAKRRGKLPYLAIDFCSKPKAQDVHKFFEKEIDKLPGGPRNLQRVTEEIKLCANLS